MDFITCEVALGGDKGNTVPKGPLSVAEAQLLQHIHGFESVFNVTFVESRTVSVRAELDRLRGTSSDDGFANYPAKNDQNQRIVDVLYPGANPRLPEKLDDLGLNDAQLSRAELDKRVMQVASIAVTPAPSGKKRGKTPTPPPPVEDDEDDLPEEPADPEDETFA